MWITGPARRGIVSLLTGLVTGAALLTAASAASAEPPAESQAEPRMKCVEQAPYFFHGVSGQQGGWFSTDAPTSPAPSAQPAGSLAVWAGSFHGDLCGWASATVYVAGVRIIDPSLRPSRVTLQIYADEGLERSAPIKQLVCIQPDENTPEEITLSFRLKAAVAEKLVFRLRYCWDGDFSAVLYDSTVYPAGFTVSTLQPCEAEDPHPDCRFAQLYDQVTGFAATGEVSADGKWQLVTVLGEAAAAYDHGGGDNAQAVTRLQDFQQLAADPTLVPSEPARAELNTAAGDLITTLEA